MPRKLNFTRDTLAGIRCPAGKSATIVYDVKTPGLALRVRDSGARAFYWIGRIRGDVRPVKHFLGDDATPIDLARRKAAAATVQAQSGVNPNDVVKAQREAAKARRTLADLWETYRVGFLETRATQKTRETNASLWRVWLSPLGERDVDDITGDDVRALHAAIARGKKRVDVVKGRGMGRRKLGGKRTANKAIAMLRRVYNYANKGARQAGRIVNPVPDSGVELFRQHSRERYLSPTEIKQFLTALDGEPDQRARDFLTLALFTGARRGNVSSMRWAEIDLAARVWHIPGAKAKGRKSIAVPLHPAALAILDRRKADNDRRDEPSAFVLPSNRSASGHIASPQFAMRRVCKAVGIENLTIHDLRRTLGSWQAAGGASQSIIGKSLGHANHASTAIYARVDLAPVRASLFGAVDAMLKSAGVSVPAGEDDAAGPR